MYIENGWSLIVLATQTALFDHIVQGMFMLLQK
jgi:hypothetical protein